MFRMRAQKGGRSETSVSVLRLLIVTGAAFLALACARVREVRAVVGTPPPFICGKTYVLAQSATDLNAVADQAAVLTINTLHYMNQISLNGNNCPPFPATINMSVTLDCTPGPGGGPMNFGPFQVQEGFTSIPVDITVPSGPQRTCTLTIASTISFIDGLQLRQTTEQMVCVVEAAAGSPSTPRLTMSHAGADSARAHAGDERSFTLRVTNNHSEPFNGNLMVESRNVAGLPAVIAGANNLRFGVFAVADPGGGDVPPVAFSADVPPGECVGLPAAPHDSTAFVINRAVQVPATSFVDVEFRARLWSLSAEGSAGQYTAELSGTFGDASPATVCAGAVLAVDQSQPPDFACPGAGQMTTGFASASPEGPGAGFFIDLPAPPLSPAAPSGRSTSTGVVFEVELATMQLFYNGQLDKGGTFEFSGVSQTDGQHVRNTTEKSFTEPQGQPDAVVTFSTTFNVKPDEGSQDLIDLSVRFVDLLDGLPNGFEQRYPTLRGEVYVDGQDGLPDIVLSFVQQLGAVGVENQTFNFRGMTNLGVDVQQLSDTSYRVTSTWTATNPGTRTFIGFSVNNDYRGFGEQVATEACCLPSGFCVEISPEECDEYAEGTPQGPGSTCVEAICAEPTGACCYSDGTCFDPVHQSDCVVGGHTWMGPDTTCATVICPLSNPAGLEVERVTWNGQSTNIAEVNVNVDAAPAGAERVYVNLLADLNGDSTFDGYTSPDGTQAEWLVQNIPLHAQQGGSVLQSMSFGLIDTRLHADGDPLNLAPPRTLNMRVVLSSDASTDPLNPGATDVVQDETVSVSSPFAKLSGGGGKETPTPPTLPPGGGTVPPVVGKGLEDIVQVKGNYDMPDNPQDRNDGANDPANPNPGMAWVRRGHDECGPTAAANSFRWLARRNGFNNLMPDEPVTGPDENLITELVNKMDTNGTRTGRNDSGGAPARGTNDEDFVTGKGGLISERNLPLSVQFKDGDSTIAGVAPMAPTEQFIWDLLDDPNGKDIEMGMTFVDAGGNPVGGHWVTLVGGIEFSNGSKYFYVHDPDDGEKGKPKTDVYRLGTRDVGGTTYLELQGYPRGHYIDIVVAECRMPTPTVEDALTPAPGAPVDTGPVDTSGFDGDGPYIFSDLPAGLIQTAPGIHNSTLPPNLMLDPNTGAITGTAPPGYGMVEVRTWVTESDTGTVVAELRRTIAVDCPPCGDLDNSGGPVDLIDFASFSGCFGAEVAPDPACRCADLNGDGTVGLLDFATFTALFNTEQTGTPPDCLMR